MGQIHLSLCLPSFSQKLLAPNLGSSKATFAPLNHTRPPSAGIFLSRGVNGVWTGGCLPSWVSPPGSWSSLSVCAFASSGQQRGPQPPRTLEHRSELSPSGVKKSNRNHCVCVCVLSERRESLSQDSKKASTSQISIRSFGEGG